MIIRKLDLQGFKSFPERTKIIFHAGITAIVGPNGTGKSNIVDAILWVLGGQRHKSLRGDKTEHIIFNGSAHKTPLGMADVTMILENEEEEVIINHRVFRSGEGEYRLNGKVVRLKDIQDALWKRAIAEKEYFVIEQGSIGLLLTSKPAEKRQLLEEAAGIAYYKDKKKQTQSKLESSEQNLTRLEDIIAEVAKAKNSLQRQAQAASRYRKLRERIREVTAFHYVRKIQQLERNHEEALSRYNKGLTQEKDLMSRVKQEEKELVQKRRELWDLEKFLKEEKESIFVLETQGNRAETEREKELRRIEMLEERRKEALASITELENERSIIEGELTQSELKLEELSGLINNKEQELTLVQEMSRQNQEKTALAEKGLKTLKEKYLNELAELTDARNDWAKIEKELEIVLRHEEKLRGKLEEEKARLEETKGKLEEKQTLHSQKINLREEKNKGISDLRALLDNTRASAEDHKDRIAERKQKRDEEFYKLQALAKMEEKARESSRTSEEIPEALGLLADLMEAEPEYASVVDLYWKDEEKAWVIRAEDFLKKIAKEEIKGRFLLLASRPPENPQPQTALPDEDVIGFLKSHLKASPQAGETLLQLPDAVIVRDIKTAVRLWLSFPGHNFATLGGDILLSNGLLKTGEKEEGLFVLSREMKYLEEKIAGLDAEILPMTRSREELTAETKDIEEKIHQEHSLQAREEEIIEDLEKEILLTRAEEEKTVTNIDLLEKEIQVLLSEKQTLSVQARSLREKLRQLEEEEIRIKEEIKTEENGITSLQEKSIQEERLFLEQRGSCRLLQEKIENLKAQNQAGSKNKMHIEAKIRSSGEEIRNWEKEEVRRREEAKSLAEKVKKIGEEKELKGKALLQKESEFQKYQAEEQAQEDRLKKLREDSLAAQEDRVKWEVSKAEIDRDLANLEETCWQDLKKNLQEVKKETQDIAMSDAEIEDELAQAEEELQKYKAVNLMAEEEFLVQKQRYDFLLQQKDDLRQSICSTEEAIRKIDEESRQQFQTALSEVNKNFQEIFVLLFTGGNAEVKLTEPASPLESGIDILAQPPGKKVQNITLLSGGEKALTSLAFLFALFRCRPTPFCILDEVDAALDDTNLARFLDLMKKIKIDTQFIIVTHNYKTMEVADYIYGTTMTEPNFTRLYSIKLEKKEIN